MSTVRLGRKKEGMNKDEQKTEHSILTHSTSPFVIDRREY